MYYHKTQADIENMTEDEYKIHLWISQLPEDVDKRSKWLEQLPETKEQRFSSQTTAWLAGFGLVLFYCGSYIFKETNILMTILMFGLLIILSGLAAFMLTLPGRIFLLKYSFYDIALKYPVRTAAIIASVIWAVLIFTKLSF